MVVQVALELASSGMGAGRVAWEVGRPFSTVRGWLRSARACAPGVEACLSALVQQVAGVVALPASGTGVGRLVSACVRFAVGAGWPVSEWLAAGASACRCRVLQASRWAQHETAVAALGWVAASSDVGP